MAVKKMGGHIDPYGSSLLISPVALAVWGVLLIAAILTGQTLFSLLLLGALLTALLARLWGLGSLKNVRVGLRADTTRVYAGDRLTLTYQVENGKFLPLIWLEVLQRLPKDGCMEPEDQELLGEMPLPEEELEQVRSRYAQAVREAEKNPDQGKKLGPLVETCPALRSKFSFVLWYQQLEWDCVWLAKKRGLWHPEELLLRSGDGFGLAQAEQLCPVEKKPLLVVYPKLVPVNVAPLLGNLWEAQTGSAGTYEDCTILRGERDYQWGDPWKRIDWRVAARGGGLQVKLYETIQPKSIHFLLDGASFLGRSEDNRELEEAISIVASLMVNLSAAQVHCGLSLPRTPSMASADLFPGEETTADDLLLYLAGFRCMGDVTRLDGLRLAGLRERMGQVYLVTWKDSDAGNQILLESMGSGGVTILTWETPQEQGAGEYRVLPLRSLKGGAPHG